MALDPAVIETSPDGRQGEPLADLARRVRALERRAGLVEVGNGAPTADPAKLSEGTTYLDRQARRKYYVVGDGVNPANNVWRYAPLT